MKYSFPNRINFQLQKVFWETFSPSWLDKYLLKKHWLWRYFSLSICCLEIKHLQKKYFLKIKSSFRINFGLNLIFLAKRLRIHVLDKLCLQIAIACLSETGCIQIRQRILSSALRMQIGNFRGCNFSSKFWNIYQKMIFALQNE